MLLTKTIILGHCSNSICKFKSKPSNKIRYKIIQIYMNNSNSNNSNSNNSNSYISNSNISPLYNKYKVWYMLITIPFIMNPIIKIFSLFNNKVLESISITISEI